MIEVTMSGVFTLRRAALLLAGVAAGAMVRMFKSADQEQIAELRQSLNALEIRVANQQALYAARLTQLEAKVGQHEQPFEDLPSTSQIVAAMEAVLSNTMSSLDARLSTQAQSIELLKTTVSQTDELLERVLESIDSLLPAEAEDAPQLAGPGTEPH